MSDFKITNKIDQSGLIILDLEDFYPKAPRSFIDIKPMLWEGMALKETLFREYLKSIDWNQYKGHYTAVGCTEDVIIPSWAYLLLSSKLIPYSKLIVQGDLNELEKTIFLLLIEKMDLNLYQDKKVLIKGCSSKKIPQEAYVQLIQKIQPIVKSLFFGEACSTVPLYKKANPSSVL